MTHMQRGLKTIIFLASMSFVLAAADTTRTSKHAESQQKSIPNLENLQRGKLASDRTAERKRITAEENQEKQKVLEKESLGLEKSEALSNKKIRPQERESNSLSFDFSISEAYVELLYDADFDGYHSEFRVTFDADTNYQYADVYAEMYLSLNGGPWELYYITDVFEIQGWSSTDDYSVTTYLTTGYPPGSYDILIDLIDTYDYSYVATISADTYYPLADWPLEDATYEDSVSYDSNVSIWDAQISLIDDFDNDGFYRSYSLLFDADVDFGTTEIYAEIWSRDDTGDWYLESITENIILDGNSSLDTYILETTLQTGYATGYYDFKIDIYDAVSQNFLTSSDEFDSVLSLVPLEDVSADTSTAGNNNSNPPPIVTSTASYGAGGAGSMFGVIGLLLLTIMGRLISRRK